MRPQPACRTIATATAVLVAVALVAALSPVADRRAAAVTPTSQTPVMGPNLLDAGQLASWYRSKRGSEKPRAPGVDNDIERLASLFIEEGRIDGVRGDIAFVQSVLETGWFTFPDYGQIRPWFNNFAGIRAYNGRTLGTTCEAETYPSRCFETARLGIRHQIHLLRGYADATTADMDGRLLNPPSDRVGAAPIWELFGGASGTVIWATDPGYGLKIIELYSDALVHSGARSECLPYSSANVEDPHGKGYWVFAGDGATFSFGRAHFWGGMSRTRLNAPIVGAASTSSGLGYWQLGGDGGVFSFGDAKFYGSTGNLRLTKPVLGMQPTKTGKGYWLVASDGGVFSFGDADFYGSTGAMRLYKPVVGMERTARGRGYWLVASDGGVFSFGSAKFYGSAGGRDLAKPIVGMERVAGRRGYWLLGAGGRVFAFGAAEHLGDLRGCDGYGKAAAILSSPTGDGYWTLTRDGSVIPFGDARRLGMPAFVGARAVALALRP